MEPTKPIRVEIQKNRSECLNSHCAHHFMRLVIITYPIKTKIALKCVFRWNNRVVSSKKRFSLSRHSPTKNASPRGVDRYVDTNETNLDARYHQPYEVRLTEASHVANFDRHREILQNVSLKASVVIVRFRRG